MIKILQVPTGLYGTGEQKISRDIGLLRDPNNLEIHYVVFTEAVDRFEPQLQERGCIVHHRPLKGRRPYFYFQLYRTLKALMKKERYDAVHAHCMFQSGIVMLAANHTGVPIRITHSHNAGKNRKRFSLLYDFVMRWLIRSCSSQLVSCGNAAGEFLFGKKTYHKRGKLILNGVDTDIFKFSSANREVARKELNLEQGFVIGIVARLEPSKNHSFLLQLMPEIIKRKPEAILLIVGDGHERVKLETQAREMGLTEHVRFLGSVDNVAHYLNAMDVFALPSLFEGMPLTLMEAQANGLPCVISENVPEDVIQTDLIHVVPLSAKDVWVKELCVAERNDSERYAEVVRARGLSYDQMLAKIYTLYGE